MLSIRRFVAFVIDLVLIVAVAIVLLAVLRPMDIATSGGSSATETREPMVTPSIRPSCSSVSTETPAACRRIASRSSSPVATGRESTALVGATLGRPE